MTEYIKAEQITSALANLPQLVFEVTDACNLKCKYCAYGEFYSDFDKREDKMLPVSKAIQLIDYLNQYWNSDQNTSAKSFMYVSFYGGEPLMNFCFIKEIVEYVETRLDCPRRKFLFSMTTNAILLHKYMDFLVKHDFRVLVSLDGNEKNDSYRVDHKGNGSFDRVVRNVDLLREKYPDFFEKNVNFNSVFHNRSTIDEVYGFFKNRYNKIPMISELNNSGIRPDKIEEFNRTYRNSEQSLRQSEHYEEIEKEMFMGAASYKSLALFLHKYSGHYFQDYLDLLNDKKDIKYIPTGTCLPFSKKMFVTVNGKILPCERIGHQFGLGQILENGVELDIVKIAHKYNVYYNKMENQCSHCKNRLSCIQCLFNLTDIESKPICYGFMNDELHNKFRQQQLNFLSLHPESYRTIMDKAITI
ncbi:MAG: radical SAM peptide maturase [Bacteroidaceae bacterium]|nr:radical SAM peptide maturase [Bacteroidaceae bacterium]MBO4841259.1 radical SAM peptide maturase [Bacteroidaceae bacterium]